MKFSFDGFPDEIERFVDFRVQLFLREAIREFHLDRGMERLAAVLGVSRDLFGVGCVEFEHSCFSFRVEGKKAHPRQIALPGVLACCISLGVSCELLLVFFVRQDDPGKDIQDIASGQLVDTIDAVFHADGPFGNTILLQNRLEVGSLL